MSQVVKREKTKAVKSLYVFWFKGKAIMKEAIILADYFVGFDCHESMGVVWPFCSA